MSEFRLGEFYSDQFKNSDIQTVKDNLDALCYDKVESQYNKNLSGNEIQDKKSELTEIVMKINELEVKKKEVMAEFKNRMQEPKVEKQQIIETLKHKSEIRKGTLWMIDVEEKGMMYFFDQEGICVDARPLMQNEKQTKIKMLNVKEN